MTTIRESMTTIRKSLTLGMVGVLLALGGCAMGTPPPPQTLHIGHTSRDGAVSVWPARGSLIHDTTRTDEVTHLVEEWRNPDGGQARLDTSAVLWLGDVDGAVLGLVAADLPGYGESWLLQISGRAGALTVSRATRYTNGTNLVYADVLPARGEGELTRYLTSARVEKLTLGNGTVVTLTDGLSAPVPTPPCAATPLTITRVASPSRPDQAVQQSSTRFLDLGSDVAPPRFPLVTDPTNTATAVFTQVPPCRFESAGGPFVLPRATATDTPDTSDTLDTLPNWPVGNIRFRAPAEALTGIGTSTLTGAVLAGTIRIIDWEVPSGLRSTVVWLGPGGPILSTADQGQPLQAFTITIAGRALVVLSWDTAYGLDPTIPTGTVALLRRPGLMVVPKAEKPVQFSLLVPGSLGPFTRSM